MAGKIEGITKEAIKEFLAEADEIVENINNDLMSISSAENIDDIDPELLNSVFRGAHSLKGIAGMLGFKDIGHLSHNLENILDSIRLGKLALTQDVLDVLFEGMEFLADLITKVGQTGEMSGEEEVNEIIEKLNKKLSGEKEEPKEKKEEKKEFFIDKRILNVLTEYEEHRLEENKKNKKNIFMFHTVFSLEIFDEELTKLTTEIKPIGEVISILPSSGEAAEGTIEFDLLVGTNKDINDVKSAITVSATIADLSSPEKAGEKKTGQKVEKKEKVKTEAVAETAQEAAEEDSAEPESKIAAEAKPALQKVRVGESLKSLSSTVRVDIHRLDSLMNTVGELVLNKAVIGEITDKLKNMEGFTGIAVDLYKANRMLARKLDELQKSVMSIRMIPLKQVFDKMNQVIRTLSRKSGKEIGLNLFGADTELDKLIVEELGDPLIHAIRNSVDHGIETPEEREKAGKPRAGTVELRASQKGNYVVIEICDDGRGINREKVRKKAIEKRIIDAHDELREKDIYNILLMPGFSTTDEVTETSGRGVGMDVVKSNISKLSGMVDIESEEGKGTKITLTLPITLAIIQALIIELSERQYAIPLNSVSEIIKISPEQIRTIEKKEVMQLRDETLPLLRLKSMFKLENTRDKRLKIYVVVVGFGAKKIGIIVDSLRGQQDIVIKSIGSTFKKIKGIAGATDLGNQKTVLVLDVGSLIEEALH